MDYVSIQGPLRETLMEPDPRSASRDIDGTISPLSLGEGPGVRVNFTPTRSRAADPVVSVNANQRRSMERTKPAVEESPFLRAYPNPSRRPVYLVYDVPDGAGTAEMQVVDANGKLLLTKALAPQNGIVELPKLTPGLNVATLLCDGIRIGVVKLSIVK